MPRNPNHKQLNTTVTAEQYALIQATATLAGCGVSEFMREALRKAVEKQGFGWVDNLPKRGKYKRK